MGMIPIRGIHGSGQKPLTLAANGVVETSVESYISPPHRVIVRVQDRNPRLRGGLLESCKIKISLAVLGKAYVFFIY
jgi:hypothetical protein